MSKFSMEKLSDYSVKIPGPTPNGGAYGILYYLGKTDGSLSTPSDAVAVEAVEYDAKGYEIFRTYLGKRQ